MKSKKGESEAGWKGEERDARSYVFIRKEDVSLWNAAENARKRKRDGDDDDDHDSDGDNDYGNNSGDRIEEDDENSDSRDEEEDLSE